MGDLSFFSLTQPSFVSLFQPVTGREMGPQTAAVKLWTSLCQFAAPSVSVCVCGCVFQFVHLGRWVWEPLGEVAAAQTKCSAFEEVFSVSQTSPRDIVHSPGAQAGKCLPDNVSDILPVNCWCVMWLRKQRVQHRPSRGCFNALITATKLLIDLEFQKCWQPVKVI